MRNILVFSEQYLGVCWQYLVVLVEVSWCVVGYILVYCWQYLGMWWQYLGVWWAISECVAGNIWVHGGINLDELMAISMCKVGNI